MRLYCRRSMTSLQNMRSFTPVAAYDNKRNGNAKINDGNAVPVEIVLTIISFHWLGDRQAKPFVFHTTNYLH
jgi:hypothetical protein